MARYTSHAQEQAEREKAKRENAIIRLRTGGGTQQVYIYLPALMDLTTPNVIRCQPIKQGEPVVIIKDRVDPMNKIVWIVDAVGNEQSVWRGALRPMPTTYQGIDEYRAMEGASWFHYPREVRRRPGVRVRQHARRAK
jgi:hypothetical protein